MTYYSFPEIITFLETRNYEHFSFHNGYAYILSSEAEEFLIEVPDGRIPDETTALVTDVYNHLDHCVMMAHKWLEHFYLKNDKWFPNALDRGFEIGGFYFGRYMYGNTPAPQTYGFTITFCTKNDYPCRFTVKFHPNLHPFAVEEWVE